MPASAIPVTGLSIGPVGRISQTDFPIVTPRQLNPTDTLSANFGDPLVLNANNTYSTVSTFLANGGTVTSTTPLAIAIEDVKTNPYYPLAGGSGMTGGMYAPGNMTDALTRGTANVKINNGTPAGAGGAVYIRVTANVAIPAGVVGGFEAIADGANTVLINNMVFKTGAISSVNGVNAAQVTLLNRTMA